MAIITTRRDQPFEEWRLQTNEDSAHLGDVDLIYSTDTAVGVSDSISLNTTDDFGTHKVVVTALNDLNTRKVKRSGDTFTGRVEVNDTTAATSHTTGAITTTGGIGVAGNVYSNGNIYGTWQGGIIETSKGGTGLGSVGSANTLLGTNAAGNGLEYKTLSSSDGSIQFTNSAGGLNIRTSGVLANSQTMNETLIVGKNTLIGAWRGTDVASITSTNILEVRTPSAVTATNLLVLANDVNNAGGANTVFRVATDGSLTIGSNRLTVAGTTGNTTIAGTLTVSGLLTVNALTVANDVTITGNLTVNGSSTTLNVNALTVSDNAIEIGAYTGGASDTTANTGGIILRGSTNKSFTWASSNASWLSSENIDLAVNKVYRINGTTVLNSNTLGAGIVNSSLTQVGTITSGTWDATTISIGRGGTGAQSANAAVINLIVGGVSGGTAGQALLTTGSSLYWGTPTSTTTVGTTIVTNRLTATGNGSTTGFTTPTYTPGTGQLRVYVNGVRQYLTSAYTETTTTSMTFLSAPANGASILFEVDGYNNYVTTAGTVTTTAISGLGLGASNVQTALETLTSLKANVASPTFTGTPAAPTPAADNNSTTIATTAWVIGQFYASNPNMDGTAGPGTSLKIARGDHTHPTDSSRSPVASPTFTGTVTFPVGSTTVQPAKFQAGSLLTTPLAHSLEWDGTNAYLTRSTASRNAVVVADGGTTTWSATVTNATSASSAINATNATYLSSSQQTAVITGKSDSLQMSATSAGTGSFICRAVGAGDSNLAGMSFNHDSYSIKLGVRADGYFGLGGWSRAAWSWYSDPSGNMVAAGNVSAYSDPRLKENVIKIDSALDKLEQLNGVYFTWKDGFKHTQVRAGRKDVGVLADQVEAIMPEVVTESIEIEGESYKTVDYSRLVPLLIEAIKELRAEVKALKG